MRLGENLPCCIVEPGSWQKKGSINYPIAGCSASYVSAQIILNPSSSSSPTGPSRLRCSADLVSGDKALLHCKKLVSACANWLRHWPQDVRPARCPVGGFSRKGGVRRRFPSSGQIIFSLKDSIADFAFTPDGLRMVLCSDCSTCPVRLHLL